jgi:hypothetical protein
MDKGPDSYYGLSLLPFTPVYKVKAHHTIFVFEPGTYPTDMFECGRIKVWPEIGKEVPKADWGHPLWP